MALPPSTPHIQPCPGSRWPQTRHLVSTSRPLAQVRQRRAPSCLPAQRPLAAPLMNSAAQVLFHIARFYFLHSVESSGISCSVHCAWRYPYRPPPEPTRSRRKRRESPPSDLGQEKRRPRGCWEGTADHIARSRASGCLPGPFQPPPITYLLHCFNTVRLPPGAQPVHSFLLAAHGRVSLSEVAIRAPPQPCSWLWSPASLPPSCRPEPALGRGCPLRRYIQELSC